jgi:hypothetical protein
MDIPLKTQACSSACRYPNHAADELFTGKAYQLCA